MSGTAWRQAGQGEDRVSDPAAGELGKPFALRLDRAEQEGLPDKASGASSSAPFRSPAFHASTTGSISSPRPSQRKKSAYTGTVA